MASWSTKRKSLYTAIFIIIAVIIVGIPLFFIFYRSPTCSDGIQNQDERGIDCGGVCSKLCQTDFLEPLILWSRSTKVSKGIYNAVALVENPNLGKGTSNANYIFKFYDSENILIKEIKSSTDIPPGQIFAVFISGINFGDRIPMRSTFSFSSNIDWQKRDKFDLSLPVSNKIISNEDTTPRIDAVISNSSVSTISNIELVVLAYDENDNVVGTSKTFLDSLSAGGSQKISFTWREPFGSKVMRFDIIPHVVTFQ